jgi:UDP-N-acetylglucosamine--N-acetylmuramyl-(pentapeptide) pyrophosphoryl-undecaprenol N-acetylglucosamine transferase
MSKRLSIMVTGGGSGGHTSAAVGIIGALETMGVAREQVVWVGSHAGIERGVAERAGIKFESVSTGKLRRYWSRENVLDAGRFLLGVGQAFYIVGRIRPDIIVSTGGFASVPVVVAGWVRRIPIVSHEQTIVPGLANRIAVRFARAMMVTFADSAKYFPAAKVRLVGNPLRTELKDPLPDRELAKRRLGLHPGVPLLYITGGASGSEVLNATVFESLVQLLPNWQIIHQCGDLPQRHSFEFLESEAAKLPASIRSRYRVYRYVGVEIRDVLASCEAVVARSGAAFVNEVIRLRLPAILVPYAHSASGEQEKLARMLAERGGALMELESRFTPDRLLQLLSSLASPELQARVKCELKALSPDYDVESRIASTILEIAGHRPNRCSVHAAAAP